MTFIAVVLSRSIVCFFRTCLCNNRIPHSVDFYFHRRGESCILVLPIGNQHHLYQGKSVHFFSFSSRTMCCTRAPNNGTIGCMEKQNNFPHYHGILSSHKCTFKALAFLGTSFLHHGYFKGYRVD